MIMFFSVMSTSLTAPLAYSIQDNTHTSEEETFIEYDMETGTERVFTLSEVLASSAKGLNNIYEYVDDNGIRYTLPHPSSINTDTSFQSEDNNNPELPDRSILDDRPYLRVHNVTTGPYCKIVLIFMTFKTSSNTFIYTTGTGAMVGNKVLLTAGHVIYHTTQHLNPYEIRVFTNYDSAKNNKNELLNETGYYHPKSWVFSANFKSTGTIDYNYDWCYLEMWDPIGSDTGYFGITAPGTVNNLFIKVSGYPDYDAERFHQFRSYGYLDSTSQFRVKHTCSTRGGHSGAPLFDVSSIIEAIHTSNYDSTHNGGVVITSTLYNLLINKINETN